MPLSFEQIRLYRGSWSAVAKALADYGGFTPEEIEAERLDILLAETGKKSSKDLTNAELDRVLDAHDRASAIAKGPSSSNRAAEQPIKRLIYSIEATGLPEPYLQAISRDQFGTADWRLLTERQLTRFRYTAVSRAAARRRAAAP